VWTVLNGADARLVRDVGDPALGLFLYRTSHDVAELAPTQWRDQTIDLDYCPMKTVTRVSSALALSFVVGVALASANGQDTLTALRSSVSFASITAALVALLSFGMEKAEDKGYPGWIGLLLVVFLNVLGLVILTLLPRCAAERTSPSQ
jgi:hypothetical protein